MLIKIMTYTSFFLSHLIRSFRYSMLFNVSPDASFKIKNQWLNILVVFFSAERDSLNFVHLNKKKTTSVFKFVSELWRHITSTSSQSGKILTENNSMWEYDRLMLVLRHLSRQ